MRIVVNTNRIIAALIREGISRKILLNRNFDFIVPDDSISEIYKYEEEIREKTKLSHEEFEILLFFLFENVVIIPKEDYSAFIPESSTLISDFKDISFIACCLATKAEGIWSEDPHFLEQNKIKIFKTKDIIDLIESQ